MILLPEMPHDIEKTAEAVKAVEDKAELAKAKASEARAAAEAKAEAEAEASEPTASDEDA